MSDLFGNHIVGFPTRRLKCVLPHLFSGPWMVDAQGGVGRNISGLRTCTDAHLRMRHWTFPQAAPVVPYFIIAFNHSIISRLCLVWVRAPFWPHVRQAKFCLRVCQVVFLGVLPFSPHLLIGPSISYELK